MEKSSQRSGRDFLDREPNLYFERFAPNHPPQTDFVFVPCRAATLSYVHGARRHLAANDAHLAERRYELPQTHRRELEEHTRFRINRLNTTTLMRITGTNGMTLYVIKKKFVRKSLVTLPEGMESKECTGRVKEALNDIYYLTEEIIDIVSTSLS